MSEKKTPYLPKVRTDYHPTKSDVESKTGVDFPIDMPNPAVDPIVVNNIAWQEFDYTQDMSDMENFYSNENKTKKSSNK